LEHYLLAIITMLAEVVDLLISPMLALVDLVAVERDQQALLLLMVQPILAAVAVEQNAVEITQAVLVVPVLSSFDT